MLKGLSSLYRKIFKGHYNILLFCLIFLFIFRPYGGSPLYLGIWKFFLTGTILSAIFNCRHSHIIKMIEVGLAIPSVLLFWLDLVWRGHPWIITSNTILTVLFVFVCTSSIIYDVLLKGKVTFETLRGVICAYFLVAIGFAYLFWFIEFCSPNTFSVRGEFLPIYSYAKFISEMLYFSFTTLLTVGYGDIIPVKDIGQTAVVIEGTIGQFYLAILVARLVASYSLSSQMNILNLMQKEKKL